MAEQTLLDKLQAFSFNEPTPESVNPSVTAAQTAAGAASPTPQAAGPVEGKPLIGQTPQPLFFDEGAPVVPPFQQAQTITKQQNSLERPNLSSDEIDQQRQSQLGANALEAQSLAQGREAQLGGNEQKAQALRNDQRSMAAEQQASFDRETSIKKGISMLEATKIDESDWWRDGGSGRTVAAFLALAAGGFVNAIKPGASSASEIIFGAIDKYVQRKVGEKNELLKRRSDLLGDEKLAQRMLKVDIRKSVLDQAALLAQRGEIDAEFGKVMANLYHQNAKELNAFALERAGKVTTTQVDTEKPASPVPWAQYGMDQKRWDRFVQGEDKKAGAAGLITSTRELGAAKAALEAMTRDGGNLPNYGAFEALLPESAKNFFARLGVDRAKSMIEVRQIVDRKVLDVISAMNSRLVDSDQERTRMQGLLEKGDTENVFRGLDQMSNKLQQEVKDRAMEAAVPGVDPNDMVRYVAQQRGAQDRKPGDFTPVRGPQATQQDLGQQQDQGREASPLGYSSQETGPLTAAKIHGLAPKLKDAISQHAQEAGLDPVSIAAVVQHESGGASGAINPLTKAHGGLIQFSKKHWPNVAAAAGQPNVSWEQMTKMSPEEQVPFVVSYFKNVFDRAGIKNPATSDYRMAAFMPAFLEEDDNFVLGEKGSKDRKADVRSGKVWEQNQSLDTNRDGKITVGEVRNGG